MSESDEGSKMRLNERSKALDAIMRKATTTKEADAPALFTEVKDAFESYFRAFNNYTTKFFEKRLDETRTTDLEDVNLRLIRIINAIVSLAKSIDYGRELNIETANAAFVDIAGIASNVITRYNHLPEKDDALIEIHTDFIACLKALNDDVVLKYNATHERNVYNIQEVYEVFRRNMPSIL